MEVRFESMVCLWDDKIPTMFLEFMNLLTFCQSEEQLRAGVKDFSEICIRTTTVRAIQSITKRIVKIVLKICTWLHLLIN